MRKIQHFSVTHILCEINFGDSTSAKSAISTNLETLNFAIYEIMHFLKAEIYPNEKFRAPKIAKMALFKILNSLKLTEKY